MNTTETKGKGVKTGKVGAVIALVLCIIFAALAQALSSSSLGTLVDDYIKPLLRQDTPDYGPLISFLLLQCVGKLLVC